MPQVDVTPSGIGILRRYFERTQRRFKDERDIVIVLSSFASLPSVLAGSNMIGLEPARMMPFLAPDSLRQIEIDFDLPGYDVSIWWHPRANANPLIRWARKELIAETQGTAAAG